MGQFEQLGRVMHQHSVLLLFCGRCGRTAALTRTQALARFGHHASPFEVRRRAKCSGCGSSAGVGMSLK